MAEYINKAKVEWFKCKGIAHFEGDEEREFILIDVKHIDELPTIDIVTCKECKHRGKHKLYQEVLIDNWCEIHGKIAADPDWFCADGEVE